MKRQLEIAVSRIALAFPKAIELSGLDAKLVFGLTNESKHLPSLLAHVFLMLHEGRLDTKTAKDDFIDCDAAVPAPKGFSIEEHKRDGRLKWSRAKVILWHAKSQMLSTGVGGNEVRTALVGMHVLNANVLDFLLNHVNLIPEDWKDKNVFFWGTLYRTTNFRKGARDICVRYLYFDPRGWRSGSVRLGDVWRSRDYAALLVV